MSTALMKANEGHSEKEVRERNTHDHAVEGQLAVHFELIGRCHTLACVEEHV